MSALTGESVGTNGNLLSEATRRGRQFRRAARKGNKVHIRYPLVGSAQTLHSGSESSATPQRGQATPRDCVRHGHLAAGYSITFTGLRQPKLHAPIITHTLISKNKKIKQNKSQTHIQTLPTPPPLKPPSKFNARKTPSPCRLKLNPQNSDTVKLTTNPINGPMQPHKR